MESGRSQPAARRAPESDHRYQTTGPAGALLLGGRVRCKFFGISLDLDVHKIYIRLAALNIFFRTMLAKYWFKKVFHNKRGPGPWKLLGTPATALGSASSTSSTCLLYTSPSPRDGLLCRMPSSA